MERIDVKIFKHGFFKETMNFKFSTKEELKKWISRIQEYTNFQKQIEEECGEEMCKYSGTFFFENKEYFIYLDF